jgi:glycerol-3-phosphate acyltransferase PlsX
MALNIDKPRVALLSNGEEDGKGNELVRETAELMRTTGFPFAGNIEGRELFEGGADVVVTDGFVGNVVLKTAEGLADSLMTMVREAVLSSPLARVGGLLIRPALSRMKKRIDYAEYGGAPLLGVNGPFFICHGKSSDLAIFNAFRVAKSVASGDLVSRLSKIQESL